jgi:hypothetical protein
VSEQDPADDRRRRTGRLLGEPAAPPTAKQRHPAADVPAPLRRAAIVVAVEALLLAGVAVYLLVLTLADDASSVGRAVAEVVYFGLAALALAAAARGLWRRSSWARGPVVVLQILLGLVGYQAAFTYARPELGVPVLLLVAVTIYLLATPEARLAYAEDDPPS